MNTPDEQTENEQPESSATPPKKPKSPKELNVVSVPSDEDMMAEEMAELFEEDQVTHQHGSSEPEGD
ncbi:MAG: hypothetical protein JSU59_01570 [Nitrospirota bacterium]|nr:MAG: hypothetical protein JSU59_01570 [Nitrospirota bacterium]